MTADGYTRTLLTVIAVLLLLLVIRSFVPAVSGEAGELEAADANRGRDELQNARMGRAAQALMRIDTATGDTWRMQGRANEAFWSIVSNEEPEEDEAQAAAPAAPTPPRVPGQRPDLPAAPVQPAAPAAPGEVEAPSAPSAP